MYNVGIIGAGVIGNRLANWFNQNPDMEIIWICDIDKSKADNLVQKFGGKSTIDYEIILEDESIDIIYVGIPPKFHTEVVLKALSANKHVICEKPLSLSRNDSISMIKQSLQTEKLCSVNLPFRFTTSFNKLKVYLEKGELGKIRRIDLKFRFPQWPRKWQMNEWLKYREQGGPLREVGTHFFFALIELEQFIGKPKRVFSIINYDPDGGCENQAYGIIEMENKLLCTFDLLTKTVDLEENTLEIQCENGKLSFKSWHQLYITKKDGETNLITDEVGGDNVVTSFVKALKNQDLNKNLVSFYDATRAQLILNAVHHSNGVWYNLNYDLDSEISK